MSEVASLDVTFRPHFINGWFLRMFARPYVKIDDEERLCSWRGPTKLTVPADSHRLSTYVRYRGASTDLGTGTIDIETPTDETTHIVTANGWLNQTPFSPRRQR